LIQSISPCGAKVPTGRYVIQSAVDASILTVSKYENQFASVHTLPPRAFIPKAQQWEIAEKEPTEYDIMPRIHETNAPVTYDSEAMKRGSFIRKVWKIESVGRGRYVFKNEWSGKCLYKTRFRQIEEHDCRAWSPNQEWVLRPLLVVPKPTPPGTPAVAEDVKYQVPSRVVDQYLEQQKYEREQQEQDIGDGSGKKSSYKIKNRRKKPTPKPSRERDMFRSRKQHMEQPPKPQILFSRNKPNFLQRHFSRYTQPPAQMMYMEGMYPIYDNVKVEDPTFPDFLLHATQNYEPTEKPEKYKPARYAVTRKPFDIPMPVGHPSFVPQRPKYDGRIKDPNFKQEPEEEESEEEDEVEEPEPKTEGQVEDALLKDKLERDQQNQSEESEEEDQDDDAGGEEDEEEPASDEKSKKEEKEVAQESEEDPAQNVAGFMKLLFKGISNKMQSEDRAHEEMINTFER